MDRNENGLLKVVEKPSPFHSIWTRYYIAFVFDNYDGTFRAECNTIEPDHIKTNQRFSSVDEAVKWIDRIIERIEAGECAWNKKIWNIAREKYGLMFLKVGDRWIASYNESDSVDGKLVEKWKPEFNWTWMYEARPGMIVRKDENEQVFESLPFASKIEPTTIIITPVDYPTWRQNIGDIKLEDHVKQVADQLCLDNKPIMINGGFFMFPGYPLFFSRRNPTEDNPQYTIEAVASL